MAQNYLKKAILNLGLGAITLILPHSAFSAKVTKAAPERTSQVSQKSPKNPTLLESTWLMPQVSVVMPSQFSLSSSNYSVDYSGQVANISQAGMAAVTPLFNLGGFRILSITKVGFSYKSGTFEAFRPGGETFADRLKLFWVPMSLGAKFLYTLPNFPYIKPSVTLGGGAHWFYQSGKMAGANQNYWVPYYYITPAVSFLEGNTPSDWFGGFTFGVTYQHDLSRTQKVSGVSFDMGINILL